MPPASKIGKPSHPSIAQSCCRAVSRAVSISGACASSASPCSFERSAVVSDEGGSLLCWNGGEEAIVSTNRQRQRMKTTMQGKSCVVGMVR